MLCIAARPRQLAARGHIAQVKPFNKARVGVAAVRPRSVVNVQAIGGLFGGGGKVDDSKMYICIDCGYIYDGREPFSAVPNSYNCPKCNSAKRRFKPYKGSEGRPRNDNKSMVARLKARQWQESFRQWLRIPGHGKEMTLRHSQTSHARMLTSKRVLDDSRRLCSALKELPVRNAGPVNVRTHFDFQLIGQVVLEARDGEIKRH
eukprot:TRINITY_DN5085_c0_g3_i1.p2 TRINITY_DN5085_c0_g3~~TRINITY_DN5085_c0_g3_i1.p2  ORF type:complete len:204 (+),score=4.54 TRINITY_DN5085_c0_g3_i1:82-693(+)